MKINLNPLKWLWFALVDQFHFAIIGASGGSNNENTNTQMQQLVNAITSGSTTGSSSVGIDPNVAKGLDVGYGDYATLTGQTPIQDIVNQGTADINQGRALLPSALDAYTRSLNAGDVGNDPYLAGAIDAAINPLQERLMRDILPGVVDQTVLNGAVGGSGAGIAKAQAITDFNRNASDVTASMVNDALQNGRQLEYNAATNLPSFIGGLGQGSASQLGLSGTGANILQQYLQTLQNDPRKTQNTNQQTQQNTTTNTSGTQQGTTDQSGWNLGFNLGG